MNTESESVLMLFSASSLLAIKSLSSTNPLGLVYLVKPLCSASIVAVLISSGVSKHGSPNPKDMICLLLSNASDIACLNNGHDEIEEDELIADLDSWMI